MKHLTDRELIARQCHSDEVLVEYERHGDLARAIRTVSQRHVETYEEQMQKIERLKQEYNRRMQQWKERCGSSCP